MARVRPRLTTNHKSRQGKGGGWGCKPHTHTLSEGAGNGVHAAEQVEAKQRRRIMMDGGVEGGN